MDKPQIPLQKILDNILAVCNTNGVWYNLEKIVGEDVGARIRIAYVRPENKIHYLMALTAGTHTNRDEDIVEEEYLLEIDWGGSKWEHKFTITVNSNSGVLAGIKNQLEAATTE